MSRLEANASKENRFGRRIQRETDADHCSKAENGGEYHGNI